MEKKMTKKEMFTMVKEVVLASGSEKADEMVAFIDHEVELLVKKSASKSKKETANDVENVRLMGVILETLADSEKGMTVTEVMKSNSELANFSNQKVSALMRKLVENGEVVKASEKGKSLFSLA